MRTADSNRSNLLALDMAQHQGEHVAKTIGLENRNGIGIITLNRPEKLNAMNVELLHDLAETLLAVENHPEIQVVVMTGSGTSFSTGGDLEEHLVFLLQSPSKRDELIKASQRIPLTLHRMRQPVIAAVKGIVFGGGLDLALLCDICIASADARFAMKFVRVGLIPDMGGTYLLPRMVGLHRALGILLSGDEIDAEEAHRIGLVNRVVPSDELMGEALATAETFLRGPLQAYAKLKWAVYTGMEAGFETALENERLAQNLLLASEDVKEATTAFLQKRQPDFKGK